MLRAMSRSGRPPLAGGSAVDNAVRKGVCINHGAKRYCTMIDCKMALFQTVMCRHHFRECLLVPSTIDMRHVGLHATIMDITDLTVEVIQQYRM